MTGPAFAETSHDPGELEALYNNLQARLLRATYDEEGQKRMGLLPSPDPSVRITVHDGQTLFSHSDAVSAFAAAYNQYATARYGPDYVQWARTQNNGVLPGLQDVPREQFDPGAVSRQILEEGRSIICVSFIQN